MTDASISAAGRPPPPHNGPALFSLRLPPVFLGAAAGGAPRLVLWVCQYAGAVPLPLAISPLDWHVHEMLYGYVAAAVAGFLLTAIPNWTGRLPVLGLPLVALVTLWIAGRLAMALSARIGLAATALID